MQWVLPNIFYNIAPPHPIFLVKEISNCPASYSEPLRSFTSEAQKVRVTLPPRGWAGALSYYRCAVVWNMRVRDDDRFGGLVPMI